METIRKDLILTFAGPSGEEVNLKITKPKAVLDGSEVKTQMNAIIASNVLGTDEIVTDVVQAVYDMRVKDVIDLEA